MSQPNKTLEQLEAELESLKRQTKIRKLERELEELKKMQRKKKNADKLRLQTELERPKNINRDIDHFLEGRKTDFPKNVRALP